MMIRYQFGSLGGDGTSLIINNEQNPDEWFNWLMEKDSSTESRHKWEIYDVMFGTGKYVDTQYMTAYQKVYVEGISK